MEKHEEVKVNEQKYLDYKSGDRNIWANHFIEDKEFYLGEQFTEEVKQSYQNRGLMAAPINETLPSIDLVIADLTSNDPRFSAVAMEDSDTKVASWVADLFFWIWYISKGQSKVERAVRDFCKGGVGVLMCYPDVYADNGRGELKITDVDPLEVYIDPRSKEPDSSDAADIIISKLLCEEVIKLNYPDFDFEHAEQETGNDYSRQRADTQGQVIFAGKPPNSREYRSIERFTKIRIKRFHVEDPNSNFEKTFEDVEDFNRWGKEPAVIVTKLGMPDRYITEDSEVQQFIQIFEKYGSTYYVVQDQMGNKDLVSGIEDPANPFAVPGSTTKLEIVAKSKLVEDGIIYYREPLVSRIKRVLSIGGILMANEILPIEEYPIVTFMLHHNRNPYASGDIRVIKPLQEQLNILDQRIQAYLRMITTLRGFVNSNSGLKKAIDKSGDPMGMEIYEIDMENNAPPVFPQYPPLPAGVMQQRENIIRQIQRIIGAYSFQDGDTSQAPRTLGATDRIDEFMRRRTAYKKRKIESSLNQLAKAISQYIPFVYNTRKMIRLLLPNHHNPITTILNDPVRGEDERIKLVNDVVTMRYDVRLISGSMMPSNRSQERAELMQTYQLGILKDPEWYIRKSDFENTDEMLERESLVNQLMGQVQQLIEQVKSLEGQLQTKSREVIQMNEKVAVEKTKSNLKGMESEIKHSVIHTKERLKDFEKIQTKSKGARNE